MTDPLLRIDKLRVGFGGTPAIEDLSLTLDRGETLVLAGESGSGKSLTALATMRLLSPRSFRVEARSMRLAGVETSRLSDEEMRQRRGSDISMTRMTLLDEPPAPLLCLRRRSRTSVAMAPALRPRIEPVISAY